MRFNYEYYFFTHTLAKSIYSPFYRLLVVSVRYVDITSFKLEFFSDTQLGGRSGVHTFKISLWSLILVQSKGDPIVIPVSSG